ncbi:hypothetical protein BH09BAC1_BH09BAC1_02450 [soil metagenome]
MIMLEPNFVTITSHSLVKLYYVYILLCADGSYYTGITNNLERRVKQHNEGLDRSAYTYSRLPVKVVYREILNDVWQAIAWEKQVKKWRREKKEAIIAGNWDILPELAACKSKVAKQSNEENVTEFD